MDKIQMKNKLTRARELYTTEGFFEVIKGGMRFISYRLLSRRRRDIIYSKIRYYKNQFKYEAVADPFRRIVVPERRITHKNTGQHYPGKEGIGYIKKGEWDKSKKKIEDIELYNVYRNRFIEKKSWGESGLVDLAKKAIERKGDYYNYKDIDQVINQRGKYIDELFENIRDTGYKSQKSGAKKFTDPVKHEEHDKLEILVNISRDGEILFYKGHNRMMLAKIIGVDEIPVQVMARHEQWQRIREQVAAGEFDGNLDCDWELKDHPDLQDVI